MGVTIDPEGRETQILHDLVDFRGKDVVEVGCGAGRMTWRYAGQARSVLALDPNEDAIAEAERQMPQALQSIVSFRTGDVRSVRLREDKHLSVLLIGVVSGDEGAGSVLGLVQY
jgi:ubiquinone/menaquinone biosynthesis C-methylase UbiE